MIVRLTENNKKVSKLKKASLIMVLIVFIVGFVFQKQIPSIEYIYMTVLILSLSFWVVMFLFSKGYVFVGELSIHDDKLQISKDGEIHDILTSDLTVIVTTIVGESGKGWALFGGSGASNKIEIHTCSRIENFYFYLSNTKEIKNLKIKLENLRRANPNIKIKIKER